MFWYKSWLDTRWLFSSHSSCSSARRCSPCSPTRSSSGCCGRARRSRRRDRPPGQRDVQLERDYRGYIWVQSFRQNLTQMGTLFAVLLGTGGLLPSGSKDTALFTMSLPASRNELLGIRAATGLLELAVLAFAPALVFPLLSPDHRPNLQRRQRNHAWRLSLHHVGAVFFSLALLLVDRRGRHLDPRGRRHLRRLLPDGCGSGRRRHGAIQHLCGDERRALLPHRHAAVGRPRRECRGGGRHAVRRRAEFRTPGFLNAVMTRSQPFVVDLRRTSLPCPRTSRSIPPRFTLSIQTDERSTGGAAGLRRMMATAPTDANIVKLRPWGTVRSEYQLPSMWIPPEPVSSWTSAPPPRTVPCKRRCSTSRRFHQPAGRS